MLRNFKPRGWVGMLRFRQLDEEDVRIKEMIYVRTDEQVNLIANDYLIPRVLSTMRDVIRFNNAFKLTITSYGQQQIINEIEFQDLFFLELLRYRFYDIYEILRSQPLSILEIDNNYIYTLKKDDKVPAIDNILEQYEISDRETINDIITCILNSSREHSLCKLRDYNKYFMLRLDDKILLESEILALMGLEETELFEKATILHKSKYPLEFENQIYEILKRIPTNTNIIENEQNKHKEYSQIYALLIAMAKTSYRPLKEEIITAIIPHVQNLYCYDVEHFRALLKLFEAIDFNSMASRQFDINNFLMSILIKDNLTVKLHKIITIDEDTVISTFLENTKHPEVISPCLTSFIEMLESNSISNDKLVLNKSELSDIQLHYFANYKYKLSLNGFTLFYNCWKEKNPVTQQVRLRDEALNIMKKEIEKAPDEYFKNFIRTGNSSHADFNTVSPEPFCRAIFGSNENFEAFLNSCNIGSLFEKRVKNYWLLYKYNGYSPVTFENQGNVNEKIENCFKDEIQQLKELLFIKEHILKNNEVDSDLIKLFENNNLYIKLRGDVLNMINNI